MFDSKSFIIAKPFLGQTVEVVIDRPLGSKHPNRNYYYQANYGYLPEVMAPDGEFLDVYYLGVDQKLDKASGKVIAIIHRFDDDDDKLVVVPQGIELKVEEIEKQVLFQEQWFKHEIIVHQNENS